MSKNPNWTDARVAELSRLGALEMGAAKIAAALSTDGVMFTRFSIVGKADRLGIKICKPRPQEAAGDVFGKLTLVSEIGRDRRGMNWLCRCACGKDRPVCVEYLRSGHVKSCGCLKRVAATPKASARTGSFTSGPRAPSPIAPSPVALPPRPLPPSPRIAVTCEPVSIMDLREGHCRWVVDKRDDHGLAMYCGGAARIGESWCCDHRALCYQPARVRAAA